MKGYEVRNSINNVHMHEKKANDSQSMIGSMEYWSSKRRRGHTASALPQPFEKTFILSFNHSSEIP